jgi:hypothetical protein
MKSYKIFLDLLSFEIRYPLGQLYWDRCGQTILDIKMLGSNWIGDVTDNATCRLEKLNKDMVLNFNSKMFHISAKKQDLDNDDIIDEANMIWKIISSNFGINEYDRVGARFQFLKPTKSIEESEHFINKSELNVTVPSYFSPEYKLSVRQVTTIFEKEEMEYRIELKGITRTEGIDPSGLFITRPKNMSKNQKLYQIDRLKKISEYSGNPMYGVMLDIDCVLYNPQRISIIEFIKNQKLIVKKDFLPILEAL